MRPMATLFPREQGRSSCQFGWLSWVSLVITVLADAALVWLGPIRIPDDVAVYQGIGLLLGSLSLGWAAGQWSRVPLVVLLGVPLLAFLSTEICRLRLGPADNGGMARYLNGAPVSLSLMFLPLAYLAFAVTRAKRRRRERAKPGFVSGFPIMPVAPQDSSGDVKRGRRAVPAPAQNVDPSPTRLDDRKHGKGD
jgi:hypothetical protein